MSSEKANYMQQIPGSERCLNGHRVVETPMDGTPWKCSEDGCEYAQSHPPKSKSSEIEAILEEAGVKDWSMGWDENKGEPVEINPLKKAKQALTQLLLTERSRLPDDIKGVMVAGVPTLRNEMDKVTIQDLRLIIQQLNNSKDVS